MDTFSINTPLELKDKKHMTAVSKLETPILIYFKQNKQSEVYITGDWDENETIEKNRESIERRNSNEIRLHKQELNKKEGKKK